MNRSETLREALLPGRGRVGAAAPARRRGDFGKWLKRALWVLVAALVALALWRALSPAPAPADLAIAERAPMRVTLDEDGRTRVRERHVVSAPQSGRLLRVTLDPGDTVRAGDVVARLVPTVPSLLDARTRAEAEARVSAARSAVVRAQAAFRAARAAAELARTEAARMAGLFAQRAIPEAEHDAAATRARTATGEAEAAAAAEKVAQSELAMARAVLARPADGAAAEIPVVAPVGGRVLRVPQESEAVVAAGTPILEIGDPADLEVVVDVLTADAVGLAPGTPVSIVRWGGPEALEGRVRLVEPHAFTKISALGIEEQRVWVRVDIVTPRTVWAALGDGFEVDARFLLWSGEDVLQVPASAVFRRGDDWAVFRVDDEERARLARVDLGRSNGAAVEIRGGLAAGDAVVDYPGERVAEGVRLEVRETR